MRNTFEALARGEAQNQPRRRLLLPSGSVLHSMAGAYGGYFGTKIYSTNRKHGAWFTFLLYDAETARPLAEFEANYLGQIRTGAVSGLAADLLAAAPEVDVGRDRQRLSSQEPTGGAGCRSTSTFCPGLEPKRRESEAVRGGAAAVVGHGCH